MTKAFPELCEAIVRDHDELRGRVLIYQSYNVSLWTSHSQELVRGHGVLPARNPLLAM